MSALQKPDATRVAGLYAWNQLGHKVKKGEKGIRILAPIFGIKPKRDEEAEKDITKQNTAVLVGFRNANGRFPDDTPTTAREIRRFTSPAPEFEELQPLPDTAVRKAKGGKIASEEKYKKQIVRSPRLSGDTLAQR